VKLFGALILYRAYSYQPPPLLLFASLLFFSLSLSRNCALLLVLAFLIDKSGKIEERKRKKLRVKLRQEQERETKR
jgi:hypothetical protein